MVKKKKTAKPKKLTVTSPTDYAVESLCSGFGSQHVSERVTSSSCTFGTADRSQIEKTWNGVEFDRMTLRTKGNAESKLGPVYNTYSGMGQSVDSRKQSCENTKFGTGGRSSIAAKTPSPGPGAYNPSKSVGKQPNSQNRTAEVCPFGSATRDMELQVWLSEEHASAMRGASKHQHYKPGPGAYNNTSALGKQALDTMRTMPSYGMGTSQRSKLLSFVEDTPAPWDYTLRSGVGKQVSSKKKSPAAAVFGTGTRKHSESVFISKDHEKTMSAPHGPGPVTASQISSISKQCVSERKTQPHVKFGTEKRLQKKVVVTPGPGHYKA